MGPHRGLYRKRGACDYFVGRARETRGLPEKTILRLRRHRFLTRLVSKAVRYKGRHRKIFSPAGAGRFPKVWAGKKRAAFARSPVTEIPEKRGAGRRPTRGLPYPFRQTWKSERFSPASTTMMLWLPAGPAFLGGPGIQARNLRDWGPGLNKNQTRVGLETRPWRELLRDTKTRPRFVAVEEALRVAATVFGSLEGEAPKTVIDIFGEQRKGIPQDAGTSTWGARPTATRRLFEGAQDFQNAGRPRTVI